MATIVDDRNASQRETHRFIVLATDKFMSGWGGAKGGASYAGWACRYEDLDKVERYVRSRGEMKRIRIVGSDYRPGPACAHLHIYVADEYNMA